MIVVVHHVMVVASVHVILVSQDVPVMYALMDITAHLRIQTVLYVTIDWARV